MAIQKQVTFSLRVQGQQLTWHARKDDLVGPTIPENESLQAGPQSQNNLLVGLEVIRELDEEQHGTQLMDDNLEDIYWNPTPTSTSNEDNDNSEKSNNSHSDDLDSSSDDSVEILEP